MFYAGPPDDQVAELLQFVIADKEIRPQITQRGHANAVSPLVGRDITTGFRGIEGLDKNGKRKGSPIGKDRQIPVLTGPTLIRKVLQLIVVFPPPIDVSLDKKD